MSSCTLLPSGVSSLMTTPLCSSMMAMRPVEAAEIIDKDLRTSAARPKTLSGNPLSLATGCAVRLKVLLSLQCRPSCSSTAPATLSSHNQSQSSSGSSRRSG
eukprot:417341-Amphidinium_carterae.2